MSLIRTNVDRIFALAERVQDRRFLRFTARLLAGMTPTMIDDALVAAVDHFSEYLVRQQGNLGKVDELITWADRMLAIAGLNGPSSGVMEPANIDGVPGTAVLRRYALSAGSAMAEECGGVGGGAEG